MAKFNLTEDDKVYYDVLKEIGNIGSGNAVTALAHMLNCKVDMSVPQVRLLDFKDVGSILGDEEQIMAGVYLMVEGDITGSIMFLLEKECSKNLIAMLMGSAPSEGDLSEIEQSALKEIGNIITAAYLNSLSTLTNLKIYPSVPSLCIDMAAAILSVPAIEFGLIGDKLLLIENQFSEGISGYFILVPDLDSYDKIFSSIGM
ncbi:MAG: chemotaxis protein CheC [Lachnospiraceae bacterium]|jgi:chemotaxis protein CheC|nr:chemotaxis protein CheC [Lachnospiraceae bacterium]MBP5275954.1 chemotaxis protein CheC [Lachnospiraceae bacterium]MBP5565191.1 chemotaxis protein CheC [Lachnospiraceae bacterium]